jgi:subtilisin family serine protease
MSYRVFSADGEGAAAFDILNAINQAVNDGCDIISMSLGSPTPQTLLRSRIEFAHDRGVLCLAATGNEGKGVSFPAAFPAVYGVGAFGKFREYPPDSGHCRAESPNRSKDGEFFLANFSNFGDKVEFCAPGVAVRSTVPGGYLALDGTSMACPQVAGLAALALASRPDLLNAPRDAERVERLVSVLRAASEILGFGAQFEGAGFPKIDRLFDR